ncbi:MAG: phosphomannomutase/phosphoglucomutase [Eubacteriaceae bacterium]
MSLLSLQNGSDIRGVAVEGVKGENVNLTNEVVTKIAYSFKNWLQKKTGSDSLTIAIGRDSRISGESLADATIKGMKGKNITIYDFGLASTPAMFMSTIDDEINADGAIMLTASHLPYNRNGLKFFTKQGGAEKKDIKEILELANDIDNIIEDEGQVIQKDFISKYADGLVNIIRKHTNEEEPFKNNKIIVDAGNGAGGFFAQKVLKPLGAQIEGSQFLEPDGYFPNHEPNPENNEAMESIQKTVIECNAQLGIIFDTDVDRAAVVDSTGKAINRNALVALMSAIVLEQYPNTTIVTDSVTSSGLKTFIDSLGGTHHRFKRGYKNVINEAIRLNSQGEQAHLAIETSGHCALKENHFLDDGAYLVTKILIKFAQLRKEGKNITDMISELNEPKDSKEIRAKINLKEFKDYGLKLLDDFAHHANDINGWSLETPNYEGVRVNCEGEKGWCLVRMSLHDPVIAINIESNIEDGCKKIESTLMNFLNKYEELVF